MMTEEIDDQELLIRAVQSCRLGTVRHLLNERKVKPCDLALKIAKDSGNLEIIELLNHSH